MNAVVKNEEQAAAPQAAACECAREYVQPQVNVFSTKDGYVLEAELPNVNKDGLTVSVEGSTLTIEGRRLASSVPESELLYRESRDTDYRRVFELDPSIESGKISAKLEQGILTLTLPKAEAVKPRTIAVA